MEESKIIDKFYGIVDFFKSNPDLIVPLLSILGTAMVALYTICAVLTKANLHDKIKGLRGHNPKIIDCDLITYLIFFLSIAISSFFARNLVTFEKVAKFIIIVFILSYILVIDKTVEVIVGKIINFLKQILIEKKIKEIIEAVKKIKNVFKEEKTKKKKSREALSEFLK